VLEELPVGIFCADAAGRCVFVNSAWREVCGVRGDAAAGKSVFDLVYPADRARVEAEWKQCGPAPFKCEFRIQKGGGVVIWVVVQAVAEYSGSGQVSGYAGTLTDITERKRGEEALRINEARFRSAFGFAPEGMALTAPNGRFLQVNRRLCQILGYSESELLQLRFHDITDPEDLERALAGARALLEGKLQLFEHEKRYHPKMARSSGFVCGAIYCSMTPGSRSTLFRTSRI